MSNCAPKIITIDNYCDIAPQPPIMDESALLLSDNWQIYVAESHRIYKEKCKIQN